MCSAKMDLFEKVKGAAGTLLSLSSDVSFFIKCHHTNFAVNRTEVAAKSFKINWRDRTSVATGASQNNEEFDYTHAILLVCKC